MKSNREIDAALVKAFIDGSGPAFDLLVTKYKSRVMGIAVRMVHDRGAAEDIVQETFLSAYRALPAFRGESSFYTWLFRIAINKAKNHLTSRNGGAGMEVQLTPEHEDGSVSAAAVVDHDSPLDALEQMRTLDVMSATLDRMSPAYSAPLLLFEIEALTYAEIAAIMDCPVGTVRSRIFRARELIARALHAFNDPGRGDDQSQEAARAARPTVSDAGPR